MKTIMMFTILTLAFITNGFSSNYEETMKVNIQKLNTEFTAPGLTNLANQFERIANAEPAKWHPRYYTAYCYVWATAVGKMPAEDKHKLLDLAQAQMDVLQKTFKKESEIFALQAFLYQMRITDMGKGMKYSGLASEALDEAEKLNPNNPRIYYVRQQRL